MATIDSNKSESEISSEALRLLECFVAGLDEVVYQIAEDIARGLQPEGTPPGRPVQIEAEHVRAAAEHALSSLRVYVKAGKVPPELKTAFEGMERCFKEKSGS